MNLVRKIKLNKIISISFTTEELEVISFLKENLKDLIVYKSDYDYPYKTFYLNKNGKYVFDIDNDFLSLNESIFHNIKKVLGYYDLKIFLKYMIGNYIKKDISYINYIDARSHVIIEQEYNRILVRKKIKKLCGE